ncbi:hypothetical protein C440_06722 [Haloferax mucosum ATCC BAA-1512]|uniref:Uncharacterized protein n=1 Tax=Haloferax mucosum ATCC BAA-1512 TaxID=662479 RepID=M0IJC9_9EURY|nr:hypothetical protein [Haloferax mucosum]ELZ95963.1 hypothetical protein C440_06722 [Haloferax mucosum ATCC BAA-1512]
MGSPLSNPLVHYGIGLVSTAVILLIAFTVVEDSTVRWLMVGIAVLELVVTPQILKRVGHAA